MRKKSVLIWQMKKDIAISKPRKCYVNIYIDERMSPLVSIGWALNCVEVSWAVEEDQLQPIVKGNNDECHGKMATANCT